MDNHGHMAGGGHWLSWYTSRARGWLIYVCFEIILITYSGLIYWNIVVIIWPNMLDLGYALRKCCHFCCCCFYHCHVYSIPSHMVDGSDMLFSTYNVWISPIYVFQTICICGIYVSCGSHICFWHMYGKKIWHRCCSWLWFGIHVQ